MDDLKGFDVVVVGAGTAGLPTALSRLENGLKVLLLEKSDRLGGTLWITGASISAAGSRLQKAKGIDDSPEVFFADANAIGHGLADEALLRLATRVTGPAVDWLEDLGVDFGDSPLLGPEHELYGTPRTHYQAERSVEGTGVPLLAAMRNGLKPFIDSGTCLVLRGCRATELLARSGRVGGCLFETGQRRRHEVEAPAVVLATGGYASNPDLLRRFNGEGAHIVSMAAPTATGAGLLMAERLGAGVSHTEYLPSGLGGIEDPANPGRCLLWVLIFVGRPTQATGDIWINREGRRFVREDHASNHHKEKALEAQTERIFYAVYDSAMRFGSSGATRQWTLDVEARDIDEFNVKRADTMEELGEKLGCGPETLRDTVDSYNRCVEIGSGEQFGRKSLTHRIEQPPFYAVRARAHMMHAAGGIKVNGDLRVTRDDGSPIGGLYAVGEVFGFARLSGDASVGGMGVGPCFSLGKHLGTILPAATEGLRRGES